MTDEDRSETGAQADRERLLTPGEVADYYRVDPKTVTRWCASGRVEGRRTPGGQWRIPESKLSPAAERPGRAAADDEPAISERTSR